MNLAQVKLESMEMLVDLIGKEQEKEEREDVVKSLLVLGSPLHLNPTVWAPSNTSHVSASTHLLIREGEVLVLVEKVLAMLWLDQLVREWIDLEKDLCKCETGPHMPTGPN